MKNLKKVFALILALTIFAGLGIFANAADFVDADDITNVSEVGLLADLKVLQGDANGAFNPKANITRAEMAAIIVRIKYGVETANAIQGTITNTGFEDVASNAWYAAYVGACKNINVINGKSATSFDPLGNVTYAEAAKMLLAVLGYGKNNEYIGGTWATNVVLDAVSNGILTGGELTSAPATREAIAKMTNAAIFCNMQKYSKDSSLYEELDKTLATETFKLVQVKGVVAVASATAKDDAKYTIAYDDAGSTIVVTVDADASAIGRTASVWGKVGKANGAKIITAVTAPVFADKVLATKVDGSYLGTGTTAIKLAATPVYYYNYAVSTKEIVDAAAAKIGVEVVIIDTNNDNAGEIVYAVEKAYAVLAAAPKADATKKTVTIDAIVVDAAQNLVEYPELAKGDVVGYYTSADGVTYFEKLDSVTAALTSIKGAAYTIGGKSYKAAAAALTTPTTADMNKDKIYFLDNYGYIVDFKAAGTEAPAATVYYGYGLNYTAKAYSAADAFLGTGGANALEKLQFVDQNGKVQVLETTFSGNTKDTTKTVATAAVPDGTDPVSGKIFSYTLNDAGLISSLKFDSVAATAPAKINKGNAYKLGTKYATSSTVFFYVDVKGTATTSDDKYQVYTGYASAITVQPTVLNYFDNKAALVITGDAIVETTIVKNYAFVVDVNPVVTVVGQDTIYTYDVIVNGEAAKIASKNAVIGTMAQGMFEYKLTDGYIDSDADFVAQSRIAEADGKVAALQPTFVALSNGEVYYTSAKTVYYKLTLNADGTAVTAVEAATEIAANTASTASYVYYTDGVAGDAAKTAGAVYFYVK